MTHRAVALLLVLSFVWPFSTPATAQDSEPPLYEARAAWVATSYRLDWPPFDQNASNETLRSVQQLALRMIMDKHVELGMNTVVFQVFTHGTAFYDSDRIPWSSLITGTVGEDPGWDPLAYAVEQAHLRGLELHAWFNVYQMGNPNTDINDQHVRNTHPEWIKEFVSGGEIRDYWINPADPDAREWLVGNVVEIVENYDVDAIHFDYIRYPGYGFSDDHHSKSDWPNGELFIDDWRRENINIFVREVYAAVEETKPWVKVGSAPIGTYKHDGTNGFWAWDHLYQASRVWMAEEVHDYLAPQLYFDIGDDGFSQHDFRGWLQDWVANAGGRHIYAGQGTWREVDGMFSSGEIGQQIDLAREFGAEGQVHFRYQYLNSSVLRSRYNVLSLPPPMTWKPTASAPSAPQNAGIAWNQDARTITVSWEASEGAADDPLRRYAVFRGEGAPPDVNSAEDLVAILGLQDTSYTDVFAEDPNPHAYYTILGQSQLGIVSAPSQTVTSATTELDVERPSSSYDLRITDIYPNPAEDVVRVDYEIGSATDVRISVYDLLGRAVKVPVDSRHTPGAYHVEVEISRLAAGVYVVELTGPAARDLRRFVVVD